MNELLEIITDFSKTASNEHQYDKAEATNIYIKTSLQYYLGYFQVEH